VFVVAGSDGLRRAFHKNRKRGCCKLRLTHMMMPPVAIKVGKSSQKLLQQIAEEAETAAVTHEQIVLLYEGLAAGIPRAARALLISMVERMREALPNLLDGL
jgi:hypothetical protein